MRNVLIENLESRELLAGVTVLIHGYDGNTTGWMSAAADAIAARGGGTSRVSEYVMTVGKNVHGNLAVQSLVLQSGPSLYKTSTGEAVIKLDWTAVDGGSYSTDAIGTIVANFMLVAHGSMRALAELPIHLIGHSRGASMAVAISRVLGQRGVWVDQNTFLDPHPVDGTGDSIGTNFGDTPMCVYSNVLFADNYWRSAGDAATSADPNGEPVDGTHESNLNNSVQQQYVGAAHLAVTAYYHGTIDTSAVSNIDEPIFSSWYGTTPDKPARTATGYYFSRIVGGRRPLDGIAPLFGGTAARTDPGMSGTQFPNAAGLRVLDGATFQSGKKITLRFLRQDRDSQSQVTFFLDPDTNPYNGNDVRTLRRVTIGQANAVTATRLTANTTGAVPGKYYICEKITDTQGNYRFVYTSRITITSAVQTQAMQTSATPFSTTAIADTHGTKPVRLIEQIQILCSTY